MALRLPVLRLLSLALLVAAPHYSVAQANRSADASIYYPEAVWQHRTPAESGLNSARLKEATDFAVANEVRSPRDLVLNHYQTFGREPFGYAIVPINERGDPTGLIIHHGYTQVPFVVPTSGNIEVASISSAAALQLPSQSYALRFEYLFGTSAPEIRLVFMKTVNPKFEILRSDANLSLTGASPA